MGHTRSSKRKQEKKILYNGPKLCGAKYSASVFLFSGLLCLQTKGKTHHQVRNERGDDSAETGRHVRGSDAATSHLRRQEFVGVEHNRLEAPRDGHLPDHSKGHHRGLMR